MKEPLILKMLEEYSASASARFHMPGHKGNAEFCKRFPMAGGDITELSFSGCLETGEGVVKQAEQAVAEILGARRTHFITDGSTCAIFAMMFTLSKRGKRVVIPRNSHKSVYNALKLLNLEPLFLSPVDTNGRVGYSLDGLEEFFKDPSVAGAMLVSPDYYGSVADLARARALADRYGKILAVDGAHGGHLCFCDPALYAGAYAHVWVDGIHKTLPCLTQGALLSVAEEALLADVEEGVGIFRTTSPSYPIMASCEYAVYYAENAREGGFEGAFELSRRAADRLEGSGYSLVKTDDRFKMIIDCAASGVDCQKLTDHLESRGVYAEFSDGRYVVLMISLHTAAEDYGLLCSALEEFRHLNGTKVAEIAQKRPVSELKTAMAMPYSEACRAEWEPINIEEAAGRIAAESVGFFPPCYPVAVAGEVITRDIADALKGADNAYGLTGGRLKVVKDQIQGKKNEG